jgi:two-component system sensor histidine kinase/response regulator
MESGSFENTPIAMPMMRITARVPRGSLVLAATVLANAFFLAYVGVFAASGRTPDRAMLYAGMCLLGAAAISCVGAYTLHRQERAMNRRDAENRLLREAAVKKDEFLASVSHELRTPLNVILGYIDLLLDHSFGPLEPAQRDILHRITKNASNLSHLINDLIDLSRIEAGRLKIELETVDLGPLFGDMRSLMEVLLAGHDVAFHTALAPGCTRVRADGERLKQIVSNLLVNAVKFTERGSITLRAEARGIDTTVVSVTDTGIGIPAAAHRAIFEPFRQVHDRSRHVPGAGIGLSISSRLAQLMGGSLTVESEPGRGSCFTLTVPAAMSDASIEPLRRVC